ncbi:hypothetical protein DWY99_13510 [[Clostridium] leptum]|uniref:Uncharacterized protein n=1 Tax=[Clostridium] leptum TaxID=1535 RepID=A0A412ATF3_9FIRM|nr:hypothetical protein DWY99_13510 [[Clostridium] leptum]
MSSTLNPERVVSGAGSLRYQGSIRHSARCEQRGPGQQGNKSGTAGGARPSSLKRKRRTVYFLFKNKGSERLVKRLARKAGGKPLGLPCSRTLCFPANPRRFFTREKTAFFFL